MNTSDIETKAEEILFAIRPCINAESYQETLAAIISLVDKQRESESDYALAKLDHAYAVGFQAGLILATNTEQSRAHWTTNGLHHDGYSEDYKQRVAAVERQRAESLKVIRGSK